MYEAISGLTAGQISVLLFASIGCVWATPHLFIGAGMRESSRRTGHSSFRTYAASNRMARVCAAALTLGVAFTAVWVLMRILSRV